MKVSEVMHTPVVSTTCHATMREACELMRSRNVGCLVVVDDLGYLAGIVTDRDVALRGVAEGRSGAASVEAVMSRDVATVSPSADVSAAQTTMQKRGVRRLPVTDDMWRPHGMISVDDIVRSVGDELDKVADTVSAQTTRVGR